MVDDVDALVTRAQHADGAAWETLYRRAYPRLLAYAQRRLPEEDAKEAVSETMTRAVASIQRFRPKGHGFEGWLFGICRHVVIDAQRRAGRQAFAPAPEPADLTELDEGLLRAEEAEALRSAFAKLTEGDRELLELRVIAGLTSEDTATALGKRPGAVRMAQARALDRLRSHLETAP